MPQTQPVTCLPGEFYTDTEVYRAELAEIYGKTWQYASHIENLQNPGDYVVLDIADENVFLICGDDHTVRGYFNVCSHRASRLLENRGCTKRITCPYHGWSYSYDGRLLAAANASNVPGFDKSRYRLKPFQVEVINGLVFANLDDAAPSFREFAPGLAEDFARYAPQLPELTFVHRTEARVKGNWKVAIENFAECYHCALLHPDLVNNIIDFSSYRVHINRHWHRHTSEERQTGNSIYNYGENGRAGSESFAGLWLWPNFAFQNYPGGAVHVWKWFPEDVSTTHVTVDWFFRSTELEDWEKTLISHHAENTFAEDLPIIERVQSGLSSRHYVPGPIMVDESQSERSEHGVADIQRYWRESMDKLMQDQK